MSLQRVVHNSKGQVALYHYQPIPKQITVGERLYNFTPKSSVSMAWVEPEDAGAILGITKVCCGGTRRPIFLYANRAQVNIWVTGDPRKDFEFDE